MIQSVAQAQAEQAGHMVKAGLASASEMDAALAKRQAVFQKEEKAMAKANENQKYGVDYQAKKTSTIASSQKILQADAKQASQIVTKENKTLTNEEEEVKKIDKQMESNHFRFSLIVSALGVVFFGIIAYSYSQWNKIGSEADGFIQSRRGD